MRTIRQDLFFPAHSAQQSPQTRGKSISCDILPLLMAVMDARAEDNTGHLLQGPVGRRGIHS